MNSRPVSESPAPWVDHVGDVVTVFRPNIPVVCKDMYLKKARRIKFYFQFLSYM